MTNASIAFEEALKEDLLDLARSNEDFDIAVFVHRGFDDVVNENILGNYNLLYSGFSIMFLYVLVMLGKFNCVEQRVWLSVAGKYIDLSFSSENTCYPSSKNTTNLNETPTTANNCKTTTQQSSHLLK